MSLAKENCLRCWLPPLTNHTLCRKCAKQSKSQLPVKVFEKNEPAALTAWIRNHTSSPEQCKAFRKFINGKLYYGTAVPEECLYCCGFLFSLNPEEFPNERAALQLVLMTTPIEMLTYRFHLWIHEDRDAFLTYMAELLDWFVERDERLCGRLVNAMLQAVDKPRRMWILEELVQRPSSYDLFLNKKEFIPSFCSHNFWQTEQSDEEWMEFWKKMRESSKRRIRFHCLRFKEELIARTWHPDRFFDWCLDIQELRQFQQDWRVR